MRTLPILSILTLSTLLALPACVSVRASLGTAIPTEGDVGVQAGIAVGVNFPTGDGAVAVTQGIGGGGPNGAGVWTKLGADWGAPLGPKASYRVGARAGYRVLGLIPEDEDQSTGTLGLNGAYLYSFAGRLNQVEDEAFPIRLQHSIGAEVEVEALTNAAVLGRGMGYAGVVYQLDGLFK